MTQAASGVWLVKAEPSAFSWKDLLDSSQQTTTWDGVRNYQARNFMRDGFRLHDLVLFYQSCANPLGVVGTMRVVQEAFADPTQFDERHEGFDARSHPSCPRWLAVRLQAETTFSTLVSLRAMRAAPECHAMKLLEKGSRLSVLPVPALAARWILRTGSKHISK